MPIKLDIFDLTIPEGSSLPQFELPVPQVRIRRTNRAAQTNRIQEPKAAAKILNLGGFRGARVRAIMDDDRRRLEAQQTIKRKRDEREEKRKKQQLEKEAKEKAKKAWEESVKHITPRLVAAGKTKEAKASSFPQIRDFLKKKHKPSKSEFATWTADNIIAKWNSYES